MPRVRVVTDSTVGLSPETVKELGIDVLPMEIYLGNDLLEDGPELDEEMFFRRMALSSVPPRSVAPPVEAFRETYERLCRTADHVLSIHVSGKLSNACATAQQAANELLGRCDITVLDSETISVGLRILVEAAGRAAAEGQSVDDIVRLIRGMIQRLYVVFFVETLDFLEREGRIRPAQALLGTMLNIKPFLTMEDGELIPMEKVRSREKAVDKLYEFVAEFSGIEQIAILQSSLRPTEETCLLLEKLKVAFPHLEIPIEVYDPTLAAHLGMGALGVSVFEGESVTL